MRACADAPVSGRARGRVSTSAAHRRGMGMPFTRRRLGIQARRGHSGQRVHLEQRHRIGVAFVADDEVDARQVPAAERRVRSHRDLLHAGDDRGRERRGANVHAAPGRVARLVRVEGIARRQDLGRRQGLGSARARARRR